MLVSRHYIVNNLNACPDATIFFEYGSYAEAKPHYHLLPLCVDLFSGAVSSRAYGSLQSEGCNYLV